MNIDVEYIYIRFSKYEKKFRINNKNLLKQCLIDNDGKGSESKLATLKDIAKITGFNVSTVSRALNNNPEINEDTRNKIIKVARQLSYYPNKLGSALSNNSSNTIGIISPEIESNFYSQLVSVIEKKITAEGYTIITGFTNFKYEEEVRFLNLFAHKAVDGIILIRSLDERTSEDLKMFKNKYEIPVVQVDTSNTLDFYDCLQIDDYLGVSLAIEHLAGLGHRRIGYIGDTLSQHRKRAYIDTLQKHEIEVNNQFIKIGEERFEEGGYKRMRELLQSKIPITAVFASYDDVAIGAMKAIYEKGLRIPEDISVVGTDNIKVSNYLFKGLTTVSVPVNELGYISTKILFEKINDKSYKVIQHVVLKPQLIIRETTASVKK